MKFRLLSDLHLEFQDRILDFTPIPLQEDKETILILAGDIATGIDAREFIEKLSKRFYKIVYVLGNHEFYNKEYNLIRKRWADLPGCGDNFILLDDNVAVIDDPYNSNIQVRLVGGTLWTDFDNGDWHKMFQAKGPNGMNDFSCIKFKSGNKTSGYRKRKFMPEDSVRAHNITKIFINETLLKPFDGKTIVITHHLPHPLCVHDQFKTHPLTCAYMTNLDSMIADHDIAVWCHGHTHTNVDFEIHGTRILCNPRGYTPNDLNEDFDDGLTFEI